MSQPPQNDALLQIVLDGQKRIEDKLDIMERDRESIDAALHRLMQAFPAGDPEGHRHYHDEQIKLIQARRELYQQILRELMKWGVLGVAAFIAYACYLYAKTLITKQGAP